MSDHNRCAESDCHETHALSAMASGDISALPWHGLPSRVSGAGDAPFGDAAFGDAPFGVAPIGDAPIGDFKAPFAPPRALDSGDEKRCSEP